VIIRVIGISRDGIRIMVVHPPAIGCCCYGNIPGSILSCIPDSWGISTVNGRIIKISVTIPVIRSLIIVIGISREFVIGRA